MRVVLGIESSCDETAVALVRENGDVLAHALASQTEHAVYGGVVPEIAARGHLQRMQQLVRQCCEEANAPLASVDAIAATTGPGLIGGVIVGTMMGKSMAAALNKPFIAINHLEAHALVVRQSVDVAFPFMLLLVSGGHCQILLVRDVGAYELLGQTRDDALGEAYDKCAKMLGLGYPGGPAVEKAAKSGDAHAYAFPSPMKGREGCDFSFSGLKTAVRTTLEEETKTTPLNDSMVNNICAAFQQAVVISVRDRVARACTQCGDEVQHLVVAGGVAANAAIRTMLEEVAADNGMQMCAAPPALCTDNGIMIAWAGIERLKRDMIDDLSVEPRARWPLSA